MYGEAGGRAGKQPAVNIIIIISLDLPYNGNVSIYQEANVAVIPRGREIYLAHQETAGKIHGYIRERSNTAERE